jgi:hypothetical protein
MARATSSLPVPRSPVMSTVALDLAARAICSRSLRIGALSPSKRRALARLLLEAPVLLGELGVLERTRERQEEAIGADRLLEEVVRAEPGRLDRDLDRALSAHHEHRSLDLHVAQGLHELASQKSMQRSTTFSSSRMFPGQA